MSYFRQIYAKLLPSGKDRSEVVVRNIVMGIGLKGVSILTSLIMVPLTIGYVSPELYGVWITLSSIMAWLSFLDVGFTQGLKNRLAEAIAADEWEKGKALVSTTYFVMIMIFTPLCIILALLTPYVPWTALLNSDSIYEPEIIRTMQVLVFFFCIQMVVNVLVSVAAAFQKVALSSSFSVVGNVLALLVIFVLVRTCPPSMVALSVAIGALPVLTTLVAGVWLFNGSFKQVAPSLTKAYVKTEYMGNLLNLGIKFFIINIQAVVLYQTTNVLISYVSSPLQVTYYNIAFRYLNVAMMFYTIITAPLWPAYTDAYARNDFEWMKRIRRKMTKILLLSVLGCLLMIAVSEPVYQLWIGDEVAVPMSMTLVVGAYVVVYCWMTLNGTLIVGIGKVYLETIVVFVGMLVHVPLALGLSQVMGAYGVIISMTVVTLCYAVIFHVQVNKILTQNAEGIWIK